jgi:hypothetical protein
MSGGFLSRWSRLKRGEAPAPAPAEAAPPAAPALPPEELEARLAELPPIEEIGPETDVTRFLADWVPKALRDAALRKAWTSDPRIAGFVEVADFQWNWNVPGGAPGCGPLEPGFDAVAHVERLFADAHAPFLRGGEDSRDLESHVPASPADAAPQHGPPPERSSDGDAVADEGASPGEVAVSAGPAAEDGEGAVQQEAAPPRLRSRSRHGGALPG